MSDKLAVVEALSVQVRLRRSTHPFHVRINHHPLLVGLTEPDYPFERYLTVLKAYFHLYQVLELRIQQFMQHHPVPFDYASRLKLPWLREDLNYFQVEPGLPAYPVEFPEILNIGQLIGVLYPLEGASLGGQVVAKSLKQHLALSSSQGSRFFNGYGADTGCLWEAFGRFADTVQDNETLCQAAEEAAVLTFVKFEEALNGSP